MNAFPAFVLFSRRRRTPARAPLRSLAMLVAMVTVICLALPGRAKATVQTEMTPEEHALLPEFCHHKEWVWTKNMHPPRSEKWERYFGKDFEPVHHYCWALVSIARWHRVGRTPMERKWDLISADQDLKFVIDNSSPQTPLLAELWTKRLQVRVLQRNEAAAAESFAAAVKADPKYWRAYWWWAYWLFKNGKPAEALRIAEQGQKNAPGAPALEKLLQEIRGGSKAKAKAKAN